jgi:hypothetical protein
MKASCNFAEAKVKYIATRKTEIENDSDKQVTGGEVEIANFEYGLLTLQVLEPESCLTSSLLSRRRCRPFPSGPEWQK